MKRKLVLLAVGVAALMMPFLPAQAITNGTPDNGSHPMVGQLFYYNPNGFDGRFTDTSGNWYSCTGTLVDATHVVTAGHCTAPIGSGGYDVWFNTLDTPPITDTLPPSICYADAPGAMLDPTSTDPNVQAALARCAYFGITDANSGLGQGNDARETAWRAALDADPHWIRAHASTVATYDPNAFFTNDLGGLVLSSPLVASYPSLPSSGRVDTLYGSDKKAVYTVVGYGYQSSMPWGNAGGGTRFYGMVTITNLNGVWGYGKGSLIALSNNNGQKHSGGTCYGDSGGPVLANDPGSSTLIAVISFGPDQYCKAGTGAYRIDQSGALHFISTLQAQTYTPPPA